MTQLTTRQRLLAALQEEPRRARSAEQLGVLLGVDSLIVRGAITELRRAGHNVRNKTGVGFWLEDGPAPPLGPSRGDGRWKGEPPLGR